MHRCVKFHDTEYTVYGAAAAVDGCCTEDGAEEPENGDGADEGNEAEENDEDEECDRDDDTGGSVIEKGGTPPTEAARGGGRGRVRRPVSRRLNME